VFVNHSDNAGPDGPRPEYTDLGIGRRDLHRHMGMAGSPEAVREAVDQSVTLTHEPGEDMEGESNRHEKRQSQDCRGRILSSLGLAARLVKLLLPSCSRDEVT
jgi:hypothetical protein